MLVTVSSIIQNSLRKGDILGRYGGEEFLVVLHDVDIDGGYQICERIRNNVANGKYIRNIEITVSGGVVEFKYEDGKDLVDKADKLLYLAKNNGRNRIER